jgi:hypothetical protein
MLAGVRSGREQMIMAQVRWLVPRQVLVDDVWWGLG